MLKSIYQINNLAYCISLSTLLVTLNPKALTALYRQLCSLVSPTLSYPPKGSLYLTTYGYIANSAARETASVQLDCYELKKTLEATQLPRGSKLTTG